MEGYARDICVVKNVNLRFKADEKIQKLKLSLDQRKNLYLVFKEAVNNALKYAECSTLSVGLTAMNKMIVLTITDDGKGFDLGGGMKGNGLKNMGLRVAEINSKLKIDSIEGKGTEIRVESPIA
jgi:signal transduction histidine kinase